MNRDVNILTAQISTKTKAINSHHGQFVKESQSLRQHINNVTHQQNEEIKQNKDKLRDKFMTETSSL